MKDSAKTNINIPIDKEVKDRLMTSAGQFGIATSKLMRDTVENFTPRIILPDEFINSCGITNILKRGVPIRSILPFLSSMLGFNMVDDFTINFNGDHVKIDPYPTYSLFCGIRMVEQLYQTVRGHENRKTFNLGK